ncbi:MAG: glutamine amidotransferase [Myxococcales bacterium]
MSTAGLPGLLVVQTGTAAKDLVERHGDYPDWFEEALGAKLRLVRAHQGERLTELPAGTKGIIVSGSPLSLTEPEPWMDELGDRLLRLGAAGVPVLGVCFGHQLLGRASGANVVRNPKGREIGTVRVQLTPEGREDPLFAWSRSGEIAVQATHIDVVDKLPKGAKLLASNEVCATQAFRLSETVASVQFHPEISPEVMRDLIGSRAEIIRAEGGDPVRLRREVRESNGAKILRAFADLSRHS